MHLYICFSATGFVRKIREYGGYGSPCNWYGYERVHFLRLIGPFNNTSSRPAVFLVHIDIILRVTAYSGESLSPTSVTKTGCTGFWLVSDINRRKLVTSSENSERVTSSVRSNKISYGYTCIMNL